MSSRVETWGPKLYVPGDMTVTPEVGAWAPEPDPQQHMSDSVKLCFLAWGDLTRFCKGWWYTDNIPITSLIPDPNATNIKLTSFIYRRQVLWSGNATANTGLLVDMDDVRVIETNLGGIDGSERTLPLDTDLTGTNIKLGLFQVAYGSLPSGWVEQHLWGYKVAGEYTTTTPPVPRTVTVNVYDVTQASQPIQGATVNLLSGVTLVDTAVTDSNGVAILNGYNKSYMVQVYAGGYTPFPYEFEVDLTYGDGVTNAPLTFVGGDGFPWWWWIPIVAGGGLIGLWLLTRALRPKREPTPPFYVVK